MVCAGPAGHRLQYQNNRSTKVQTLTLIFTNRSMNLANLQLQYIGRGEEAMLGWGGGGVITECIIYYLIMWLSML